MTPRIKKIIRLAVIIVVLVAITIPSWLYWREKQEDPEQSVIQSFMMNYGTQGTLLSINQAENIYIAQWENTTAYVTSLYIDGLWIELGRSPKQPVEQGGE